ncbi:NAD(P)-binding protein [Ceratobasidium sp. AG-I]|nr:NAD(P)-binding protein [Ceratobasidium sp. AG-I]
MSFPSTIFILGATGYVGGSLLVSLLTEYPSAKFSALVRKAAAGEAVKALAPERITIIQGSHSDHELIQTQVQKADIVLNIADADDLELTKSIVKGLEKKNSKGIFIHTSGSAVIIDGSINGSLTAQGHRKWDDTNVEDLRGIPDTAPHRNVDLEVLAAHNSGIAETYIVCPGLVYGTATSPGHQKSIQIPQLVKTALARRKVVHVGEGANIWSTIHIQDLVTLYLTVIKQALAQHGPASKVDAYDNFYFASSGEKSIKDLAALIAPLLYKKGLVDSAEVGSVTVEEETPLAMYLGHTSRVLSKRAGNLGWSPKAASLDKTIEGDIEVIMKALSG